MAKITNIEYEIKGVKYSTPVKCGVDGYFKAVLPTEVATALNIHAELIFATLSKLQDSFKETIEKYKNSVTKQELFILIRYGSAGRFADYKDGSSLFFDKYGVSLSFSSQNSNILLFHFKVCIKETVDGNINWFETKLGKDFPHWDKEQNENPDTYFKAGKCHSEREYKKIPYSYEALTTLQNAEEKIRAASEALFKFIEQDEEEILLRLTNQKLLQ